MTSDEMEVELRALKELVLSQFARVNSRVFPEDADPPATGMESIYKQSSWAAPPVIGEDLKKSLQQIYTRPKKT